jgi:hypothetical protein
MDIDYFRGLGYSEKVWHVASNPNAAAFAYDRLQLHRASAVVQMSRIWAAAERARVISRDAAQTASPAELMAYVQGARDQMIPVLFEIHFYFVAWTNCGHMMTVLTGDRAFLEAKKVFDSYKKTFDHYAHGRNSFEHFHDRLPGRGDAARAKERQADSAGPHRVYFGLQGQSYKHSDQTWDVSPANLALLNRVVDEVTGLVHQAADSLIEAKFAERSGRGN